MSIVFRIHKFKRAKIDSGPSLDRDSGFSLKGTNNTAVILIHGLTGTPNEMKSLAFFLNRKGYNVECPRLANHGKPVEILKNTHWQEFYQSARIAFLKAKQEYSTVFVSGLSMGALLALLLADEFKNEVSGVSCLSPTLFYDGWNVPWYRCFLPIVTVTPLKHFFYFKEESPYGIRDERLRERIHRYYSRANLDNIENVEQWGYPYFPISLFYQLHLLIKYATKRFQYIDAPVQLIQAKNDDMTSVKNSQFIYDKVKSLIKEIVLLPNSYHVITADLERGMVSQKMAYFFDKIYHNFKNHDPIRL